MSEYCNKCNNGKMVFYDGAFENEPLFKCNNCGYETEDLEEQDE